MRYNKKGVSGVVTVLIIVALSIVAIGVVWKVILPMFTTGTQNIDYGAKCLELEVRASDVICDEAFVCGLTLTRTLGNIEFNGVKLIFKDADGNQGTAYEPVSDIMYTNGQEYFEDINSGLDDAPSKVDVSVYFLDQENNKHECSGSTTFNNIEIG